MEPLSSQNDQPTAAAKVALRTFFAEPGNRGGVFYERQLTVIFEARFFHWVTGRALIELVDDGSITSTSYDRASGSPLRFFHHPSLRYPRRKFAAVAALVQRFSHPDFTRGLGDQGELLCDLALSEAGLRRRAEDVNAWNGHTWTETEHDLDRVFSSPTRDFGVEVKNTLGYIERDELELKSRMCQQLGLTPLFFLRWAPKSYVHLVNQLGGYVFLFQYQLYPLGHASFAKEVHQALLLPVAAPRRLYETTVARLRKVLLQVP